MELLLLRCAVVGACVTKTEDRWRADCVNNGFEWMPTPSDCSVPGPVPPRSPVGSAASYLSCTRCVGANHRWCRSGKPICLVWIQHLVRSSHCLPSPLSDTTSTVGTCVDINTACTTGHLQIDYTQAIKYVFWVLGMLHIGGSLIYETSSHVRLPFLKKSCISECSDCIGQGHGFCTGSKRRRAWIWRKFTVVVPFCRGWVLRGWQKLCAFRQTYPVVLSLLEVYTEFKVHHIRRRVRGRMLWLIAA